MLDAAMSWQRDAVCGTKHAAAMTADAKPSDEYLSQLGQICATCPVTRDCARYALNTGPVGFWAGIWVDHKGAHRNHAIAALKRKAAIV